jgi:uncharacterized protein (DUF58 family)
VPLFGSDFLTRLEYLSLVSRRVFRGSILAQRRTMQRGGGIEFADHRDYSPGDDFRLLDWNVYARHDELLLKRYQEEEDLHVYLLLDCSKSMATGTKFDLARQVTAALAYIALADLDRIAVLAFADRIIADFPLTRGKSRILSLLKFLEGLEPTGTETDLARVMSGFVHRQQRRGLVILVSDFFDPKGYSEPLDLLRHRRYEPLVVQLFDPREANPALLGDLELEDVETGSIDQVTITERALSRYRKLFAEHNDGLAGYCRGHSLSCAQTTTNTTFDDLVLRMMRREQITASV